MAAADRPALPDVETHLRTNLLFDAIWHHVLDDRCHRMLFRMTLIRRPWDWALMMQLGDADDGEQQTEATAERLRTTSVLGEVQERREDRWMRRFQVHPTTIRYITERIEASEADILKQATYLRVGTYLEEVVKTSHDIHDALGAGHCEPENLVPLPYQRHQRRRREAQAGIAELQDSPLTAARDLLAW